MAPAVQCAAAAHTRVQQQTDLCETQALHSLAVAKGLLPSQAKSPVLCRLGMPPGGLRARPG